MKYIKKFETIDYYDIDEGDYVLIKTESSLSNVREFINNNIGRVAYMNYNYNVITVGYNDVPKNVEGFFSKIYPEYPYTRQFQFNRVKEFGKTIEELELKMQANKYNL